MYIVLLYNVKETMLNMYIVLLYNVKETMLNKNNGIC